MLRPWGVRQHTVYLAAAPEYGKSDFTQRMEREIARAEKRYSKAHYFGIADEMDYPGFSAEGLPVGPDRRGLQRFSQATSVCFRMFIRKAKVSELPFIYAHLPTSPDRGPSSGKGSINVGPNAGIDDILRRPHPSVL